MSMYEVIGTNTPEYLLADPNGADLIAIPCKPGNGKINRGTVMYRGADGMWLPAAAAEAVDTNSLAVLDESVDTDANATIAEDARAFRAGRLIAGKVTLKNGAALTAAIQLTLRKQGIVFDQMVQDLLTVTYKANGGTGNDVTDNANANAPYTVKGNQFTAPSGKTFSKWNTAADGSGTDYTAAASVTLEESLTLYAVWNS